MRPKLCVAGSADIYESHVCHLRAKEISPIIVISWAGLVDQLHQLYDTWNEYTVR